MRCELLPLIAYPSLAVAPGPFALLLPFPICAGNTLAVSPGLSSCSERSTDFPDRSIPALPYSGDTFMPKNFAALRGFHAVVRSFVLLSVFPLQVSFLDRRAAAPECAQAGAAVAVEFIERT